MTFTPIAEPSQGFGRTSRARSDFGAAATAVKPEIPAGPILARMTLRARIVAALVLAALVPMAVVLVVPLFRAQRRASDETEARVERATRQAKVLLARERAVTRLATDRAASELESDRAALAALLRGPQALASPVARALRERYGLDRLVITTDSGAVLAEHEAPSVGVPLLEERRIDAGGEMLRLHAEHGLGPAFIADVEAVTGQTARLGIDPSACGTPRVEISVAAGAALCVTVAVATPREVRMDLLRSFAGTAPIALVAALSVGLFLAARIARPIRALTERAEEISARHAGPLSLLPEKDETRRLTIAFERMLSGLSDSERQRLAAERVAAWEEIARRLAHEIKNPLSPIQLAVANLRRVHERAPAEFDRALADESATILEEVDTLRRLVDEFAQFARLPRLSPEACDPRSIVEQTLALYAARIEAEHVRVSVRDALAPSTARLDAGQVGRALKNVVQNALDAMEAVAERELAIEVRGTSGVSPEVWFVVSDTGPGFGAEALRRVFEPYFTTRGERGGTGLGMAIAYRIAAEHGGSIRVTGRSGPGATVVIALPIGGPPSVPRKMSAREGARRCRPS